MNNKTNFPTANGREQGLSSYDISSLLQQNDTETTLLKDVLGIVSE